MSKNAKEKNGYTNGAVGKSRDLDSLDSDDYDEEGLRCGYFKWTPNWLQGCNTPRMLLACVCWFTFTQGM